jgi:hypothetical protein
MAGGYNISRLQNNTIPTCQLRFRGSDIYTTEQKSNILRVLSPSGRKFYKRVQPENVMAGHNNIVTEYLSVSLNHANSQVPKKLAIRA